MDFDLSEEQSALQEMARDFLRESWPAEHMRRALDAMPARIDDDLWSQIVSLGWLGVAAPEDVGGIGGDVMTAAVLAEEAGRALLPGPLLSSLTAAIAIEQSGDTALRGGLLAELIDGRKRVSVAIDEPGGGREPGRLHTVARPEGGQWRLEGCKILVPDFEGCDVLLVAARTPEGPGLLAVPADAAGLRSSPMRRLDAQAASELVFEDVIVQPQQLLGVAERAEAALRRCLDVQAVLTAADLLGGASAALELTTAYACERVQFGRPIGSFQAVSHRLADRLVEIEIGRSLLYAACLALDEERADAPALVSAAKVWLSDAAVATAESALQIHGGVGFSWEYDVHLHLRRAHCNAALQGDADFHRDRIALHMESTSMPSARGR